jgi:hypothetical protein
VLRASDKFVIFSRIISFLHGLKNGLHRAQPAMSRRIALLEQELGVATVGSFRDGPKDQTRNLDMSVTAQDSGFALTRAPE